MFVIVPTRRLKCGNLLLCHIHRFRYSIGTSYSELFSNIICEIILIETMYLESLGCGEILMLRGSVLPVYNTWLCYFMTTLSNWQIVNLNSQMYAVA